MEYEVMTRQTLNKLARSYVEVIDRVKIGFQNLGEAKQLIKNALGSPYDFLFSDPLKDYFLEEFESPRSDMNKSLMKIKENFWSYTLKLSGIRELMGPEDRDKMDSMFRNHETPEFSESNLLATLQGFYESQDDIFMSSVKSCYRRLRPIDYNHRYKTNKTWKVGDKVILAGVFGVNRWIDRTDLIGDLDKIFHLLDGKGFPKYPVDLVTQIKTAMRNARDIIETEYFKCKAYYKSGTLHINLKRKDLLQRFNEIGATGSNSIGRD